MLAAVEETTETMQLETELQRQVATLPAAIAVITTAEQYVAACEAVRVRKDFIKDAKVKLDPVCDTAYKAWQAATALRKSIIDPVESEAKKIGAVIIAYDNEQRRLAEEAERTRAEAARKAEEEAQRHNDTLMPWEQPVEIAEAVQEAVAKVEAPAAVVPASVAGIATKFKPWQGRVTDRRKFLAWCMAIETDDRLDAYVQFAAPALNALAKKVTDAGSIPGFDGYRERTISGR